MALNRGDIAFNSFNADEDGWSIVALVDIDPNTVIYFTDNEATSTTAFNTGESYHQWNTGTSAILAGTVIRFSAIDNATNLAASIGTLTRLSVSQSTNYGLSQDNETVYAYLADSGSPSTPVTFLAAVSTEGTTNLTPAGLANGTDAIVLSNGSDYGVYNGLRTGQANFAAYKTLVNNVSNWQDFGNGTFAASVPNTTSFTVTAGTPQPDLTVLSITDSPDPVTVNNTLTYTINLQNNGTANASGVDLNFTLPAGVTFNTASGSGFTATQTAGVVSFVGGSIAAGVTVALTVTVTPTATGSITSGTAIVDPNNTITESNEGNNTATEITTTVVNPGPLVTIAATDATAAEAGITPNTGTFTVTRTGDPTSALTVSYTVAGTATNATDYNSLSGSVVIPAGQASTTIMVTPVNDANSGEGSETVLLTLTDTANYDLGAAASATVTIADNTAGSLKKVGGFTSTNGAEIPAFDAGSDRLFVVAASTVEIYNVSNTGALTLAGILAPGFTAPAGTEILPNSVAVKNGVVAVAYAVRNTSTGAQQLGQVTLYNAADGAVLNSVQVGYLPDMLTFTPDGSKVLVANEGEPNSYGQTNSFDPEGSVSVINLAGGVANATVQTAGFTSFNSQLATLKAAGVRITGLNATVAQDIEPEYIAVAPDGLTARVTLQENNAIAILDIATATITSIQPLGLKDYSQPGNGLDANDRDVNGTSAGGGRINIQTQPVFGMYQPDAIASYTANGQTYYITANEGDGRDYTGFGDETTVGNAAYILDPTAFPNAATLKDNANLGRLTVSRVSGDTDGDGDIDQIQAYGARSFTIWDSSGNRVFDSGDQLEQITAVQVPSIFNSNGSFTSPNFDTRSDNKGPEPEGVVVGVVNGRTYAFIGAERTGDVFVYEVTNPTNPVFVEYINTPEDISPEGLTFISAADSPTGKSLLVTANEVSNTVAVFEFTPPVRISDIQGASHRSPLVGQTVSNVPGIVTALASNGFYLQDPNPDTNDATSEGIFVFTSSAPTVAVGDSIRVNGTVTEFRPGGASGTNNLTITEITSPTITVLSSGNALPAATILGNGGRTIPTTVIDNDTTGSLNAGASTTFDPSQDGIDFYESLEGMRVQVNNPLATSPTRSFGTSQEIWVLADNGANATSRTARGGSLITLTDFNPERIQIDDLNNSLVLPTVNVGTQLSSVVGVVNYDFSNYEVLVSTAPTVVTPSPLQKEVTALAPTANQLTVATFNVENLDPSDGTTKFSNLANRIVANLLAPDIITVEEIQDNNGATNDGVVDASTTYQTLINAIVAAGGPAYQYRQIDPVDDQDGGEPGGNIRQGFLFNPNRVSFVDGSLQRLTDTNLTDGDAFASSRKPLVGTFTFNGQQVTVVGNHFNSKGGDQPLFGTNQPPVLSSEAQRSQQATIVANYVQTILASNSAANVIVAGDLNDFEFSNPLTILENVGLTSLVETLPANERYTYNFEGNAQVLDHILASGNLRTNLDGYDVVHINSEFADQDSDHDPVVARFNLTNRISGTSGRDTLQGTAYGDYIVGGVGGDTLTGGVGADYFVYTQITDRGDFIADFTAGSDQIVLTQLLDSLVPGGYTGTNAIADGYVRVRDITSGSSGFRFSVDIDSDGTTGRDIFRSFLTGTGPGLTLTAMNNPNNFVF